ncbi:MAG: LytTR family DNA-binding domain-containing protein [Bacteroidota bacterium]|nr:LytTR family DNA-binding domain-containing protein [Bacteroidota bacterium]
MYNSPLEEIVFIEAMDDYVKINRVDKSTVVARSTMKAILKKLPETLFARIHKSFIVNTAKVEAVQAGSIEIAGKEFPIGTTYKDQVNKNF